MSRKQRLYDALSTELKPVVLDIIDESHTHQRQGTETHFKITVVSEHFCTVSLINRHRMINALAATELTTGLHALSLHLYTPDEWARRGTAAPETPPCQHRT